MSRMLKMPSEAELPDGPHRRFVEELFVHYRAASRPTLREIAKWIKDHQDAQDLRGTASTETIRRVMNGTSVPRWFTVETILEALCGLAGRSTDEERSPDDEWSSFTFKDELRQRWNAVIDQPEKDLAELPPRPKPPQPSENDPWAVAKPSTFADEPPF